MGALTRSTELTELRQHLVAVEHELAETRAELEHARLNEQRYQRLLACSPDGMLVFDDRGSVLEANQRAADLLGYLAHELLRRNLFDLEPQLALGEAREQLEALRPGEVVTVHGQHNRHDGLLSVLEIRLTFLERRTTGLRYVAYLRDVTDRQEVVRALSENSERSRQMLEDYQARLVQVERLATLGTLGAAVGHELNNLGQVYMGAADFLALDQDRSERIGQVVAELWRATEQLSEHARHLLAAGRPSSSSAETIDLGAQVERTVRLLRQSGKLKRTPVELTIPSKAIFVEMNRCRLEQVIINLLTNAAESLSGAGGCTRVEVRSEGDKAILIVGDDGHGIAPEHMGQIFDAYFTTKENHVGLGLLVVKQICRDYGGFIKVRSTPESGTEVRCTLPACDSDESSEVPSGWRLPPRKGRR